MIALLPAFGLGLSDLHASGQLGRLCRIEFARYAKAFDGAVWFSANTETEDGPFAWGFPWRFRAEFRPWTVPCHHLWGLLLPLARRRLLRECVGLHVMNLTGAWPALVARWLWGCPYTLQIGYDHPAVARARGSRLKPPVLRGLRRVAVRYASGVIVSDAKLMGGLACRNVAVIPNGVDLAAFTPIWSPAWEPRASTVCYVGRLSREKNLLRLAEAVAGMPGVGLHLIGDGPLRPALQDRPRVVLHGVLDHAGLPSILASHGAFVLPSLTEGSPKALLEAMALAMPVAASVHAGVVEPGKTGLTFDPYSVEDMREALWQLLTTPEAAGEMGRAGRHYIEAHHDLAVLLPREIGFVKRALTGNG